MIIEAIESILGIFGQFQIYIVGALFLMVAFFVVYWYKKTNPSTNMKVLYTSEVEKLCTFLDVTKLSSKSIYTKDNKRFFRR